MKIEEQILERFDRIEDQIAPVSASARAISELRDELAPRVNEAVHALITELADVEADFQIEDLVFLVKKAMRNVNNFSYALDQLKNLIDFATNVEPLLKITIPQIILYLDDLEQKGVFRMLNMLMAFTKAVGADRSEEQLAQMGSGLARLMGLLDKLTDPAALDFLEKAASIPSKINLDEAAPVGPMGMMWALRDDAAKKGLGVMAQMARAMGQAAAPAA